MTRYAVGALLVAALLLAASSWVPAQTPAATTYYVATGDSGTSFRASDRELATWALDAWARHSGGLLRFEPGDEAQAKIRVYWAGGDGGRYGEMRRILVDGQPASIVYVRPDIAALGPEIAQLADGDPLVREAIVYLTCLHEIGHALGLEHTDRFDDIMYSFGYGGDIPGFFTRYRNQLQSRADIASVAGLSPSDISRLKDALR